MRPAPGTLLIGTPVTATLSTTPAVAAGGQRHRHDHAPDQQPVGAPVAPDGHQPDRHPRCERHRDRRHLRLRRHLRRHRRRRHLQPHQSLRPVHLRLKRPGRPGGLPDAGRTTTSSSCSRHSPWESPPSLLIYSLATPSSPTLLGQTAAHVPVEQLSKRRRVLDLEQPCLHLGTRLSVQHLQRPDLRRVR